MSEQEHAENRPPVVPIVLWPGASPIYVPRENADDAMSLLKGERALLPEPGEPDVRRVLDLCPGAGEFSIYCRLWWPTAWVDLIARTEEEERFCRVNAAPGTRVLREVPDGKYDLVRLDEWIVPALTGHFDNNTSTYVVPLGRTKCFTGWETSIIFLDGVTVGEMSGFALSAQGMREKGRGFQWWVRSRVE